MKYIVDPANNKERLDKYVNAKLPLLSRAFIKKLGEEGKVLVNNVQEKSGHKLHEGDQITVDYDPSELEKIPEISLPVLYEDADCIVINKPAGILTHSKGAFNPEATVATFLRSRVKGLSGERAGIVHRLDRATSGVIIAAKNPNALTWLQRQFSQRKVKKQYVAVVTGVPEPQKAEIDMPIERNPKKPQTFRAASDGKPATTVYEVSTHNQKQSLVKLLPKTGRTHQLRVHMHAIGHPILGDALYGGKNANRLYLHALSLEITLPNKTRRTFTVPMPAEFEEAIRG